VHPALAQWVRHGGSLIYVGADRDPFHEVHEWWSRPAQRYAAPSEHLFETLGLARRPDEGEYRCGKGLVIVERKHPAYFSRSAENAGRLMVLVRRGVEAAGGKYVETNCLRLCRGPYVVATVMDESVTNEPLRIHGRFVDLLDASLAIRNEVVVESGRQVWLLDLDKVTPGPPLPLAAAGRIETWKPTGKQLRYSISSPEGVQVATRILLPERVAHVTVDGQPCGDVEWDEGSKTVLIGHAGQPEGVEVTVTW
jgi:hypothetical protein